MRFGSHRVGCAIDTCTIYRPVYVSIIYTCIYGCAHVLRAYLYMVVLMSSGHIYIWLCSCLNAGEEKTEAEGLEEFIT